MEPGTIYRQKCHFSCDVFLKRIRKNYLEIVQKPNQLVLDLKNGMRLEWVVIQKKDKNEVYLRTAGKMANPLEITRRPYPKPTWTNRNSRPREKMPFTDVALPQILRFVELNKRRNWAKRIPGIRYGFEKSRPAPIKKVTMSCTNDFRPVYQWPGYIFVNMD